MSEAPVGVVSVAFECLLLWCDLCMESVFTNLGLTSLAGPLTSGKTSREPIAPGSLGTAQTIYRMQDMVTLGKREPKIRALVGQLVKNCSPKDYWCYAEQAFLFCRDKIKYVYDPNGVELIENPVRILEMGLADCDSIVILLASLLENMGFPCRFVTIKADKLRPDEFSHVFLEVKLPKRGWISADATQPDKPFGWNPGSQYPRKSWPASKDGAEERDADEMSGFGDVNWNPGGMSGLAETLPGVEDTPGVLVKKPWEFRTEPALISSSPESLELQPLAGKQAGLPSGAPMQEFWLTQQLPVIDEMTEIAPQLTVMSGLGAGESTMRGIPNWVWIVGGAVLLMWLSKRR